MEFEIVDEKHPNYKEKYENGEIIKQSIPHDIKWKN